MHVNLFLDICYLKLHVNDLFCSAKEVWFLQDLNQPKVEATLPDGLLSVSLLRHQVFLFVY